MAGPLTEVTLGLRLPDNPLSRLLTSRSDARVVLSPIGGNGTTPPMRYLISAHGLDEETKRLKELLSGFFDELEELRHQTAGITCFTGRIGSGLQGPVTQFVQTALATPGSDVIQRPVLLCGHEAYFCVVTTREGPLEEGVQRLILEMKDQGLEARIMRLGPHRPSHNPGTYEEELTQKQADFLRTALALGLYDTPRRITLEALASTFGISKAAAHNRMRSAERKILRSYFNM